MSFCQRHNFQVDKVPLENGGWIGGRQNLWLIASLMWQGPAAWGNWSTLRVDTFCVSLSCRLLLAWPWGPRARQFYIVDTTWSAPTFLLWLLIGPGHPAVANLLVNINLSESKAGGWGGFISLKYPSLHFVSLHPFIYSVRQARHLFQAIFVCLAPCSSLVQYIGAIY